MNSTRTGPVRTCVGCRQRDDQVRLLRVAMRSGHLMTDPGRRILGRGAYVHYGLSCIDRGERRGGLARSLRAHVSSEDVDTLREFVEQAATNQR